MEHEPQCPCRNVKEREVKKAILRAFNELPKLRDNLIRMQGAAWDGDIKRIDSVLENLKEQERRIKSRMEEATESEETQFLTDEADRLEKEKAKLLLERAEAANKEVHIRLLLELVDIMCGKNGESENTRRRPAMITMSLSGGHGT